MGTNKKLELILANIVSNVLCDNILKFSKRLNKIKRAYTKYTYMGCFFNIENIFSSEATL